jgi:hypothetical protein
MLLTKSELHMLTFIHNSNKRNRKGCWMSDYYYEFCENKNEGKSMLDALSNKGLVNYIEMISGDLVTITEVGREYYA